MALAMRARPLLPSLFLRGGARVGALKGGMAGNRAEAAPPPLLTPARKGRGGEFTQGMPGR
jgi:hypothetical protein